MKNKKNVTAKTIVANRNNAKSSTGPHTQRGKDFAKFNALKYGLFAEEDVIPLCDGDEAAIKYQRFVRDLCKDFRPYGVFQTAQLDIMAKNLWRLRRGTRAEYGCVRVAALWDRRLPPPEDSYAQHLGRSLSVTEQCVKILDAAMEEIQRTGTLSQQTYASVVPLVEDPRHVNPLETEKRPNALIDDKFAQRLERKKSAFEADARRIQTELKRMISDRLAASALPPEKEMDKILRYESQAGKQLDKALERLLECQKRGKEPNLYFQGEAQGDPLTGGK